MNIPISKKHGVNPSVGVCPVCGTEHSVLLHGKMTMRDGKDRIIDSDAKAPRRSAMLCDKCKSVLDNGGAFLIETRDGEAGQNPYRTGKIVGIKAEAFRQLMPDAESMIAFICESDLRNLMGEFYDSEISGL